MKHLSQKSWRTNTVFIIILWLVLLVASITVLSSVITPFLKTLQTQSVFSLDWAGYAVSSNLIAPQPFVVGVKGSWTVPRVVASVDDSYSSAWIGIGGQLDETLIQCGTEHDFTNGREQYLVWYELLPANAVTVNGIKISPGDNIKASIAFVNTSTNDWTLEIENLSNGQSFRRNFAYNSSKLSAEWVVERPTVNNQITDLADFGEITFTDAKATIADTVGTIRSFSNYEIIMNNRDNAQLTSVSNLNSDGSSFSVTYGSYP
ncbi:MAG TPA: G1 family glutamic endopeptidase [Candidatus Bathyarchaeia archaeon]|nr:G1 family glutamic endopeptidase [Candidatus Bathyarchaeia archaeon]